MPIDSAVVDYMVNNNGIDYNLRKAAEEMVELGLVLIQKTNKKIDGAPATQEIIDEIGDVMIRLEVLKKLFPMDKIDKRVDHKMNIFRNYIATKKYSKF